MQEKPLSAIASLISSQILILWDKRTSYLDVMFKDALQMSQ